MGRIPDDMRITLYVYTPCAYPATRLGAALERLERLPDYLYLPLSEQIPRHTAPQYTIRLTP